MLFWEGEACVGIFPIIEGSVKIFRPSPGGREVMLSIETAPAMLAELPLFDGGEYPASVRAVEPVLWLFINQSDFQRFCRQYPDVALKGLAVIGRRPRQMVGRVESMTFGSVAQRLAKILLDASGAAARTFSTYRPSGPGLPLGDGPRGNFAKSRKLPGPGLDQASGSATGNHQPCRARARGRITGATHRRGKLPRKRMLT